MSSKRKLTQVQPKVKMADTNVGTAYSSREDAGAKERKRFYDSKLWQDTRDAKLRRDPLCQVCAAEKLVTEAEHVDHWIALSQGGHATADENLVSMCEPCHSRKTMCERNGTAFPRIVASKARTFAIA